MDLFGEIFDFNGDGKMTLDEEFIAYKIFEDSTEDDEPDDIFSDDDFSDETDN